MLHHLLHIYLYTHMYHATRIPILVVYEVYTRSCRISAINQSVKKKKHASQNGPVSFSFLTSARAASSFSMKAFASEFVPPLSWQDHLGIPRLQWPGQGRFCKLGVPSCGQSVGSILRPLIFGNSQIVEGCRALYRRGYLVVP